MSVVTTTSTIRYNGNGSTTVFAYNFRILDASDLVVKVGGVTQTITTHYTVSGVGDASGGNVTFTAGNTPPSGTNNVVFTRSVTNTQATDYQDGDKLSADVIETDFDRRTMQSQELDNQVNSVAIRVPLEHTASSFSGLLPDPGLATSQGKAVQINAAGTGMELSDISLGTLASQQANNVDIDGGTIDGTTIGGASAAAGTFTTATANTKVVTPEVEKSGATLLLDAAGGTLDADATTIDMDATTINIDGSTTVTIDNSNTSNGVKVGTNTSGGKVYLGHTTSETTVNDNLTVTGNLTVQGTTTELSSTVLTVDDKNLELGSVATPSDATADGGGITLKGASDKTIIWDNANDNWTSNQHLNISTGKEFKINNTKVLDATSLGSGVVGTSITSTGTIASGTWQGTAVAPQYGGTGQNLSSSTGALKISSGTVSAGTLDVDKGGTGQTSYTNGQLLIGNTSGNTLNKATLTAGTGISVTNAGGSITIANTGNAAQADMNGSELILDADGDTSITADTDDQIDIKIGGADDFQFTANTFTALSGSTISADTIAETTSASGVTIDGVLLKDGVLGANTVDSDAYVDGSIDSAHIGNDQIDSQHYAAGSIDLEHMSSESVDEDNLHISNAGSNGEFLQKQSGNAGGLTWASASASLTPACIVKRDADQSIAHNTLTVLSYADEVVDTDNAYDTSTYRFTPQTAGKYVCGVYLVLNLPNGDYLDAIISKNGAQTYKFKSHSGYSNWVSSGCVAIVDMNGSTDYVSPMCHQHSGGSLTSEDYQGHQSYFFAYRLPGV